MIFKNLKQLYEFVEMSLIEGIRARNPINEDGHTQRAHKSIIDIAVL